MSDSSIFDADTERALFTSVEQGWMSVGAREPAVLDDATELRRLMGDERRLRVSGRWVAGPTTLLEVLRLQHDEVRNCRVVRWLLDPLAPHGIGVEALRLMLKRSNELAREQGLDVYEFPGVEFATVAVEEARGNTRADIVITGPSWLVVVEAKINAGEQPAQGERLSDRWPDATYIYLTRRGDPMTTAGTERWIMMRWADLLGSVSQAATSCGDLSPHGSAADRAQRAVRDYLHGARRLTK